MRDEECYLKPAKEELPPENKLPGELQELIEKLRRIPFEHAKEQVDFWVELCRLSSGDRDRILKEIKIK